MEVQVLQVFTVTRSHLRTVQTDRRLYRDMLGCALCAPDGRSMHENWSGIARPAGSSKINTNLGKSSVQDSVSLGTGACTSYLYTRMRPREACLLGRVKPSVQCAQGQTPKAQGGGDINWERHFEFPALAPPLRLAKYLVARDEKKDYLYCCAQY